MFKTKGGGDKGFLNNVKKKADLVAGGTPKVPCPLEAPTFNLTSSLWQFATVNWRGQNPKGLKLLK